jgi:hypothetical protein
MEYIWRHPKWNQLWCIQVQTLLQNEIKINVDCFSCVGVNQDVACVPVSKPNYGTKH